jgi:RimJ/RimL family protein N-acetyltransferase
MLKIFHNRPVDYENLKVLYKDKEDLEKAWPGSTYPFSVDEWKNFITSSPDYASLLFELNDQYIGHLLLKSNELKRLYVCFVILQKEFRGRGLIYEMMKMAEEFAINNFNYNDLWLHVDPENLAALKVYEKIGFKKIEVTETCRLRMKKEIKAPMRFA